MVLANRISIFVAAAVLVASMLACGESNTGSKIDSSKPTALPPTTAIYKVGDVVQVKDSTITLNSTKFTGDVLKANFTVENKGTKDMAVSSIISFSAKDSEGTKLDQSVMDCGSSLDGKVLPGDKLRGDICWKGANGVVKIYYEASLFGSGAIVWQVAKQ